VIGLIAGGGLKLITAAGDRNKNQGEDCDIIFSRRVLGERGC